MRIIMIGLAAAAMAVPAMLDSAMAQPRPWCLQAGLGGPGGGLPHCTFHSVEQCRASIGGGTDGCYRNPALAWDRLEGKNQPSRRKPRGYEN